MREKTTYGDIADLVAKRAAVFKKALNDPSIQQPFVDESTATHMWKDANSLYQPQNDSFDKELTFEERHIMLEQFYFDEKEPTYLRMIFGPVGSSLSKHVDNEVSKLIAFLHPTITRTVDQHLQRAERASNRGKRFNFASRSRSRPRALAVKPGRIPPEEKEKEKEKEKPKPPAKKAPKPPAARNVKGNPNRPFTANELQIQKDLGVTDQEMRDMGFGKKRDPYANPAAAAKAPAAKPADADVIDLTVEPKKAGKKPEIIDLTQD